MGTLIYSNLIDLLLEEGDKTKEELVKVAVERFGFPNIDGSLQSKIGIALSTKKVSGYIVQDGAGKYHLLEIDNSQLLGRRTFVETLRMAPKQYMEERPHLVKLKEALERML